MTQSARKNRQNSDIPKRGRGKGGWRADGEGTSQATQSEQSQVVDLTQVEYLNYQDHIHHDVTDGGYDDQHIPDDVVPVLERMILQKRPPQRRYLINHPFLEDRNIHLSYSLMPTT